mgnify:FL=1
MMEEELSFEEIMKKLEEITMELENGDLDLEKSVSKFGEGMKLSKKCNEILENAEKRISVLIEKDGKLEEKNFIEEED